MKNNIKYILITILMCFFVFAPSVSADITIKERKDIKIEGKNVYKNYQNLVTNTSGVTSGNAGILIVNIDGKDYTGFCIDFGVTISMGTSIDPLTLESYFRNVLGESETKELIKKITLYSKFGYGTSSTTTDKYYMATQQLIWEAISDSGFYNSDFYEQRSGRKIKIANFKWMLDGTTEIDLSNEITTIEKSIQDYKKSYYTTPAFCTSQNKVEIQTGETVTYTDNNNVLSEYQVLCSEGLTCKADGNKLTVTASDKAGKQQITFIKPETGKEHNVYRVGNTQGMLLIQEGVTDAVTCDFGVDTYKNEKTADIQIMYIFLGGLFFGIMGYISYYTKKSLEKIN